MLDEDFMFISFSICNLYKKVFILVTKQTNLSTETKKAT